MTDILKKTYLRLLLPALVALLLSALIKETGWLPININLSLPLIAPVIFVLAVVCAVAMPIYLRASFAHKVRHLRAVSETELIIFEQRIMSVALITPYLILPAYLFNFAEFYFLGIIMMALYAVYYFYPSVKRIQFDKRIFRVRP